MACFVLKFFGNNDTTIGVERKMVLRQTRFSLHGMWMKKPAITPAINHRLNCLINFAIRTVIKQQAVPSLVFSLKCRRRRRAFSVYTRMTHLMCQNNINERLKNFIGNKFHYDIIVVVHSTRQSVSLQWIFFLWLKSESCCDHILMMMTRKCIVKSSVYSTPMCQSNGDQKKFRKTKLR